MARPPSTWSGTDGGSPTASTKGKRFVLRTVNSSTKEYKDVETAFLKTTTKKKIQKVLLYFIL